MSIDQNSALANGEPSVAGSLLPPVSFLVESAANIYDDIGTLEVGSISCLGTAIFARTGKTAKGHSHV